jgi:hypothetical protein
LECYALPVGSVYLEMSAKMQMQAMAIAGPEGEVVFMDDDEVIE